MIEFFRKQSGVRLDVDDLEALYNKDMIDILAELIISMDDFSVGDVEIQAEEAMGELGEILKNIRFFQNDD